jgi:hypothetical protein
VPEHEGTAEERAPSIELLPTVSVAEQLSGVPAFDPPLVRGLLHPREVTVVGAPRAIGKSYLAMQVAAAVGGAGEDVLGLPVEAHGAVLLLDGELTRRQARSRWERLVAGPLPEVHELFLDEHPCRLSVEEVRSSRVNPGGERAETRRFEAVLAPELEATIEAIGAVLLVVDPWVTFYTGDENSNAQVESAIAALRGIARRTGVAVFITHHFGKSTDVRSVEDQWRGASRLADAASTRLTLTFHYSLKEAEDMGMPPEEAARHVDFYFLRRDEPVAPFVGYRTSGGYWLRTELPLGKGTGSDRRRPQICPEDVAAALQSSGGTWASRAEAAKALRISRDAVTKVLADAVDAGHVREVPSGAGYSYELVMSPDDDEEF